MNKDEERAAKERLEKKIVRNPMSVRRKRWVPETEEVETGHIPASDSEDHGWNAKSWGKRPDDGTRWYDSDLAWHKGDEEWHPDFVGLERVIAGRKRQAAVQRDHRDEELRAFKAYKRAEAAEIREQDEVWCGWVLAEVKLTPKQQALLKGEAEMKPAAKSQMLTRIDDTVRRTLQRV